MHLSAAYFYLIQTNKIFGSLKNMLIFDPQILKITTINFFTK